MGIKNRRLAQRMRGDLETAARTKQGITKPKWVQITLEEVIERRKATQSQEQAASADDEKAAIPADSSS